MRATFLICAVGVAIVFLNGCSAGQNAPVHVVDLNKVLDILDKVLQEPLPGDAAGKNEQDKAAAPENEAADENQIAEVKDDKAMTDAFLNQFADQLNAAKLISAPIGVRFQPAGSIEGFVDNNKDMKMSGTGETHLFEVQIDQERKRLIASDKNGNHHRDRPYRYRPSGFFMGYMLGNMFTRQNSYYSGARTKPKFGSMKMSSKSYHSSAVSQARAKSSRSSSPRSKGGSRGFSFGK